MRQTRQNTQIQTNQASAEEQFAAITAAAHAEALQVVEDLLSDNDSIDYSPTDQQTTAQIEVQQPTDCAFGTRRNIEQLARQCHRQFP